MYKEILNETNNAGKFNSLRITSKVWKKIQSGSSVDYKNGETIYERLWNLISLLDKKVEEAKGKENKSKATFKYVLNINNREQDEKIQLKAIFNKKSKNAIVMLLNEESEKKEVLQA